MTSTPLAANTSSALSKRGFGERVGVDPKEKGAVDILGLR